MRIRWKVSFNGENVIRKKINPSIYLINDNLTLAFKGMRWRIWDMPHLDIIDDVLTQIWEENR
jgi:hypothetical protein